MERSSGHDDHRPRSGRQLTPRRDQRAPLVVRGGVARRRGGRVSRIKDERDAPPLAARLDLEKRTATTHTPGRYLDVYAAAAALDRAIEASARDVAVPMFEIAPNASSEEVAKIDTTTVVSRF